MCQILDQSVQGLRSFDTHKIAISHWLAASHLQQHIRTYPCDTVMNLATSSLDRWSQNTAIWFNEYLSNLPALNVNFHCHLFLWSSWFLSSSVSRVLLLVLLKISGVAGNFYRASGYKARYCYNNSVRPLPVLCPNEWIWSHCFGNLVAASF